MPTSKIKNALENYVPSMNRSQLMEYKSATLILDAYNANPSSMKQALLNLSKMPQAYKIAIIGDMRELGEESLREHISILNLANSLNFNELATVGNEFGKVNNSEDIVTASGARQEVIHFNETENAIVWFQNKKFENETCILIKGSRGMKLETLLEKPQAH